MSRRSWLILISFAWVFLALESGAQPDTALGSASVIHQGNLVVSGNNLTVIEGRFDINGSIIVEQNATLSLKDAVLNFTQKGMNHNITLRNAAAGNPRLIAQNSVITQDGYGMDLYLLGNSTGLIEKSRLDEEVGMRLKESSSLLILNSTIHFMDLRSLASCQMTGSSATKGMLAYEWSSLRIRDCHIPYVYCNDNSTVDICDSNIDSNLLAKIRDGNCSVLRLRPTFVKYWNLWLNCSVSLAPGGTAPSVTVADTQVGGWFFSIYGSSIVTVCESELHQVRTDGSSALDIDCSSVGGPISAYGSSLTWARGSTLGKILANADSRVWMFNSTATLCTAGQGSSIHVCQPMDVHVEDSSGRVEGANVTAHEPKGSKADSRLTDASGTASLLLAERVLNATGWQVAGIYQVRADDRGRTTSAMVDLNTTREITLTLMGSPIGEGVLPSMALLVISSISALRRAMKTRPQSIAAPGCISRETSQTSRPKTPS